LHKENLWQVVKKGKKKFQALCYSNDKIGDIKMKKWISLFIVMISLNTVNAVEELPLMQKTFVIETNQGTFEVELKPEIAPKTCENFSKLVAKGYYDGIVFHRIIKDFMIQGGDPTGTGRGGESIWGKKFEDEVTPAVKFNKKGLLAMANAGPNTNGSQFFITTVETPWLNLKHTIFGEVTAGYDVIKKIESAKTISDRPIEPIKIIKAYAKTQ
jgi:peptidylprolyl isomerase